MSFKIVKLTVGRGITVADEKGGKWERQYFELEAEITEENALELAKGNLESLLDAWLKGENIAPEPTIKGSTKLPFDASKIQWQDRENEKEKFQVSEDYDNPEHKALLKFLNEHAGGCVNSEGYFYWVYKNGSTVGRKLRQK